MCCTLWGCSRCGCKQEAIAALKKALRLQPHDALILASLSAVKLNRHNMQVLENPVRFRFVCYTRGGAGTHLHWSCGILPRSNADVIVLHHSCVDGTSCELTERSLD